MWPREWRLRIALTIAVIGIVLGLVLIYHAPDDPPVDVLRETATEVQAAEDVRTTATVALAEARGRARAAGSNAEAALSRSTAARARARVAGAAEVVVSAAADAAPAAVKVPAAVVERMELDSTAVATLVTLVRWKDTVIVRQDQRIRADSIELVATTRAFTVLERVKAPRCGRRCGIMLGVGSMLAAAVTIEQVRRTFR